MQPLRTAVHRLLSRYSRQAHIPQSLIARIAGRAADEARLQVARDINRGADPAIALEAALRGACEVMRELIVFAPSVPDMIRGELERALISRGGSREVLSEPKTGAHKGTPADLLRAGKGRGAWRVFAEAAGISERVVYSLRSGHNIREDNRILIAKAITARGVPCEPEDLIWPNTPKGRAPAQG
jgi:hypothetical protein